MNRYYSFYSKDTSLKINVVPTIEDVIARQQLLRENKLVVVGETWIVGQGYTTIWESTNPKLTTDQQNLLCLREL